MVLPGARSIVFKKGWGGGAAGLFKNLAKQIKKEVDIRKSQT